MLALGPSPQHIHTHTFTEQNRTMPGVSIPPRTWLSSQARWELLERVLLLYLESGGLGQPMCPGLTHPRLPLSSFPQSLASIPLTIHISASTTPAQGPGPRRGLPSKDASYGPPLLPKTSTGGGGRSRGGRSTQGKFPEPQCHALRAPLLPLELKPES